MGGVRVAVVQRNEYGCPVAGRGHWQLVPVEGLVELLVGLTIVALSRCTEHVQGSLHLSDYFLHNWSRQFGSMVAMMEMTWYLVDFTAGLAALTLWL